MRTSSPSQGLPVFFIIITLFSAGINVYSVYLDLEFTWLLFFIITPIFIYFIYVYFFYPDLDKNQNIADSIYYLGFSATIITLATAAIIHFGMQSDFQLRSLNLVFSQFAVGLIATCVGLILRLITVAKVDGLVVSAEEEFKQRQNLAQSFQQLHLEIRSFSEELHKVNTEFRQQQLDLQQETLQSLRTVREEALQDTRKAAEQAISSIELSTTQSVLKISQTISDLKDHQISANHHMQQNIFDLSQQSISQIKNFTDQSTQETASALQSLSIQQRELNKAAFQNLNDLAQSSYVALNKINFEELGEKINTSTSQINLDLKQLSVVMDHLAKIIDRNNHKLEQSTAQNHHQVQELNKSMLALNQIIEQSEQDFKAYQSTLSSASDMINKNSELYQLHNETTSKSLKEIIDLNKNYNEECRIYRENYQDDIATLKEATKLTVNALSDIANHASAYVEKTLKSEIKHEK